MKAFRVTRLILWSILLALCITTIVTYFVVTRTITDEKQIESIAKEAQIHKVIRDEILAPQLLDEAKNANYSDLIDRALIDRALAASFTDQELETLFKPAISSLTQWIDSKQPDASFTIDSKKQMEVFVTKLADEVSDKVSSLPDCTYLNTFSDLENGVCKSPLATRDEVHAEILTQLRSNTIIKDGIISSDQLNLPVTLIRQTRNLPEYINILYSLTIFAAGIALLLTLWLLIKHRFAGIITLGVAGLLASLLLVALQVSLLDYVKAIALEPSYQQILRALTDAASAEITSMILLVAGISIVALLIGIVGAILIKRRAQSPQIHLTHPE